MGWCEYRNAGLAPAYVSPWMYQHVYHPQKGIKTQNIKYLSEGEAEMPACRKP